MENEADGATASVRARVRAALVEGVAQRDGDPAAARAALLRARVQARALGDDDVEAEALFELARLAEREGDVDACVALATEAVDVAGRLTGVDPHARDADRSAEAALVEAKAEHLLAVVQYSVGNHLEALTHAERSLDAHRRAGGGDGGVGDRERPNVLNTIAAIHQARGESDRAIESYERALRVADAFGDQRFAAVVHGNIARIRASRREYADAVRLGRQAVELAGVHAPDVVANLLADLAESYVGAGDHDMGAACLGEAERILQLRLAGGDRPSSGAALGVSMARARVALATDEPAAAVDVLCAVRDAASRGHLAEFEVEADELLVQAYTMLGRHADALEARTRHALRSRALVDLAVEHRVRTLNSAHAAVVARQRAEIHRLRERPLPELGASGDIDAAAAIQLDAFERLAVLAEFRDAETGEHTRRVGDVAAEIAHAAGEAPEWCEQLRLAARLHDIGKVAVPDVVLLKTGPLTVDEFELMKTHTTVGHQILAGSSSPLFQLAAELALSHHEWWDGNGYPLRRAGTEIPLSGRIVALADVYDALCSRRAYKRPWPRAEAARFVVTGRGSQFDPGLVDAFVEVLAARHPELAGELR